VKNTSLASPSKVKEDIRRTSTPGPSLARGVVLAGWACRVHIHRCLLIVFRHPLIPLSRRWGVAVYTTGTCPWGATSRHKQVH
jgi:hypothetical protein